MNIFTEPTHQEAQPILAHKFFDRSSDRIATNAILVGKLPRLALDEDTEARQRLGQAQLLSTSSALTAGGTQGKT